MAKKSETNFRINRVYPDLDALENTFRESIQQVAIRGTCDIILSINGFFVWLELKAVGEESTPLQKYKAEQVRKKGKGLAFQADPNNWPEVYEKLRQIAQGGHHGKETFTVSKLRRNKT